MLKRAKVWKDNGLALKHTGYVVQIWERGQRNVRKHSSLPRPGPDLEQRPCRLSPRGFQRALTLVYRSISQWYVDKLWRLHLQACIIEQNGIIGRGTSYLGDWHLPLLTCSVLSSSMNHLFHSPQQTTYRMLRSDKFPHVKRVSRRERL